METPPKDDDLALHVRASDYDRFLCIQLAPANKRPALYAVTAFHSELARIAETVSEPLLGHIRLAWWREALEEIASGARPRHHPVTQGLADVYAAEPTSFIPLLQMVEARAADLDESLLAEEGAWLAYLDGTAGALHRAWALLLDAPNAARHEAVIASAARAYAMIGLVRAIPYLAAQGFNRFPAERLMQAGLTSFAPSAQLQQCVARLIGDMPPVDTKIFQSKTLLPLKGLTQLSSLYKKSMRKCGNDPYRDHPMRLAVIMRIIQMKLLLC